MLATATSISTANLRLQAKIRAQEDRRVAAE